MNILILTLLYYIEGREDLIHDTKAVHYLAKYWTAENNVLVYNTYAHSYKVLNRYLKKKNREYYRNGYSFEVDRVKVHLAEFQKYPGQKWNLLPGQAKKLQKEFDVFIKKEKFVPDAIITHLPCVSADYISHIRDMFPGAPVIGVLHKTDAIELESGRRRPEDLDRTCDFLFARSPGVYRRAAKFPLRHLRSQTVVSGIKLNYSVNPHSFSSGKPVHIVYAGKVTIPIKRVDVILRALASVKVDFTFDVIGKGKDEEKLKKLAYELGIADKVNFIGQVPREEVAERMKTADLFCMPSVNETLGLVYLEAMSVGCVPIGTVGEGIDGIIADGQNGFLVSKEDTVRLLAECIERFAGLSVPEKQRLSDAAFETAQELEEKKCSDRYLELIKQCVDEKACK